jgi:hypothetical protein
MGADVVGCIEIVFVVTVDGNLVVTDLECGRNSGFDI